MAVGLVKEIREIKEFKEKSLTSLTEYPTTEVNSRTSEEKWADFSARYDDQVPLCQRGI